MVVADLAHPDRGRYHRLFRGVDVVLHLGYRRPEVRTTGVWGVDPGALETFDAELANVRMAQNVYRCALDAGVRRVVAASSNHAADWYEHALVHAGKREVISPADLPLSDNFYGWAKAAYGTKARLSRFLSPAPRLGAPGVRPMATSPPWPE